MTEDNIHANESLRNKLITTKRDDYTRDRFRWWDTLAADPEMSPGTFIVGYAIATALQRNSGNKVLVSASNEPDDVVCEAWIGAAEIAEKIGMSAGTVFANVQKLKEHGYIQIDPGKPGSGHSHHYRLVEKDRRADYSKRQSKITKGRCADHSKKSKGQPADHLSPEKVSGLTNKGQPADMNPFVTSRNPFEEKPIEGGAPPARPRRALSGEGIPFPATMSESMITRALERAGWKSSRVGIEYGKFRHRCSSTGKQSHDWEAEWALWVERGLEYDACRKAVRHREVIDNDGNDVTPPPSRSEKAPPQTNMERGRRMFGGAR